MLDVAADPARGGGRRPAAGGGVGLVGATAVVVGNMVGVGVFTSLGFQLLDVRGGFSLMLLWVLGGVYSLLGALCYAELTAALPRSGGEYHLLSRTVHPAAGFASGWLSSTVGFAAPVALASMAFGAYLGGVFGWGAAGRSALSVGLIAAMAACHLRGVAFGARFQVVATVLKVLLALGLGVCGLVLAGGRGDVAFLPGEATLSEVFSGGFAVSFYFVTFSYSGWNAAAYVAGEVRDPRRNVPRALVAGTLLVTALYVLLNAAFLASTPAERLAGKAEVGLVAARSIFGAAGGDVAGLLIAFGLVSAVSAMTWAGPRVALVMGEDHRALRFLARRTARGVPACAILIQSVIAAALAVTNQFERVLTYIEFALVLSLAATVCGLMRMRWRERRCGVGEPGCAVEAGRFRTPLFPLVPLLFIAVSAYISVRALLRQPAESLWGLATLAAGFGVYWLVAGRGGAAGRE